MMITSNSKSKSNVIPPLLLVAILSQVHIANCQDRSFSLTVSTHDVTVLTNTSEPFNLLLSGNLSQDVSITFVKQHANLVDLVPSTVHLTMNGDQVNSTTIDIIGLQPGHLLVTAKAEPNKTDWMTDDVFVRITVANSKVIIYISIIFGWIYFAAWSISFYPQIYINFKRKNVSGLNFDFVVLNIVGFALYSTFNVGLFWIPEIQEEYASRFPRGLNPVMMNDVVFSLHAAFASIVTIIQCLIYEGDDQKVSKTATGLLVCFGGIVTVTAGLAAYNIIHWLDFLYYCSYIKLTITIIKYLPQAVMNYRRKSTVGWSIGNILLDFIGATLSMMQMILNAYNYDDWVSIFGDPTKFGLGLFSLLFDVFFILQHYVFYRHSKEISISQVTTVEDFNNDVRISKDERMQ